MIATSIQICIYRAKEIDQHRSYAINVVSIGQNARDEEDGLKKMVLWRRKRKEEGGRSSAWKMKKQNNRAPVV